MKKLIYLIVLALILGLVLAGCSLLSNLGQVPATEQSGITYLTKTVPPIPSANLVGLWHFDFDTGANDSTANHNDGTFEGDAGIIFAGYFGNAVGFDGDGDYVEIASDSSIMPATLTVEAWIQPGKTGARQSIISKWDGWVDASYSLELTADNKFLFYLHNGTQTQSITGTTTVSVGTWYHVAGTYDGSKASLYVNRSCEAGPTTLVAPMTTSNVPLRIGASAAGSPSYPIHSPFKGLVDEVRIWNVALLPNQLGIIYDFGGFLPPVSLGKPFRMGSTIPIKFQLTDVQGAFITDALPSISWELSSGGVPSGVVIDGDLSGAANTDSTFRYDPDSNQYIFNLSTKGLTAPATYSITVDLGDGTTQQVNIGLK
jgi:hypothetical protein